MFTFFNGCGIPPVTLTCPQGGHAQAQNVGPTGTQGCTQPGHCLGPTGTQGCTIVGPTGTQGCTLPPNCFGPTGTQGCTMPPNCLLGPTAYLGCHQGTAQAQTILPPTWFGQCGIPPVTITAQAQNVVPNTIGCTAITPCPTIPCPAGGNAQAQTIGITGWHGCVTPTGTPPATVCPQPTLTAQTIGHTGWQGCTVVGPTGYQGCITPTGTPPATVCPQPTGNAQAQTLGPTAYQGCPGTAATLCTQQPMCGPTHIGCTGYEGCPHPTLTAATVCTQIGCDGGDAQAQTIGHTAYPGCGQPGTMATVCTQVQCGPTHLLGCTGYEGCHQPAGTAATECTQVGCDGGGNAQAQIHSIPVADCIPTRSCTGVWPAC